MEIEVPKINIQGEVNIEAANGKGGVNLSWTIGGQGEKIYKVYQKSENENEWTEIQTTEETSLIVNTAKDIAVPNAPKIQITGINKDNKINISQSATDNGSIYKFYVEAYDKADNNIKLSTSEEITKDIKTGVKGYYYTIEDTTREINNETYIRRSSNTKILLCIHIRGNNRKTYRHRYR